jgi:hypothetical protein
MSRGMATLLVLGACAALPATAHGAETWLQPETLSKAGTYNDRARLATNSPGTAAVIWTEFLGTRTPRNTIRVSTRGPDTKWEPSQQLSGAGDAGAGAVGVDPQNRITAVWDEAGKVMFADKAPGQPWTAADEIPDGAGQKPDLFVASSGTATAVWQKGTTADTLVIRTARRPLGGEWSAVETISPAWSYRPHIEGDTAGDVTVSYTHEAAGRYIYAVDRPNSGPWGTQTPVAGPAITDNISDLVVAPNSGRATVFWQNGSTSAPLAARTRAAGADWSTGGTTEEISGGTAGRLDLDELDRAAADGTGLVTATWLAGNKVLTAYRSESVGRWTEPTPPAEIDHGDGTQLHTLQIASNAFGRAVTTWTAGSTANRWSLRGPGGGTPWSAPKAIDGVPADAAGLDLAVDGTGRVAYVWLAEDPVDDNVVSLAISSYGNPLSSPQPPAHPGPAPPTGGGSSGGGAGGGAGPPPAAAKAKAKLQGTPTTKRGVAFVLTMPAAGTARIVISRAAPARAAAASKVKYRRVGVVSVKLKQGRNVVRVRKLKKRKLTRAKYRAVITPKVGKRTLKPIRLAFRIRR